MASLPVAKFHGVGPVTAAKMHALGIETGADLRRQTLDFLRNHFGKSGTWYNELARGQDDRPVQPGRERKSSGSETTFPEDLIDPGRIEAGVVAMADEVWTWCERANSRGRTVTVKIKWADFRISTRSRSLETTIDTRDRLHEVALDLIRSVFPPPKGVRLVGVTLSNFRSPGASEGAELPFLKCRTTDRILSWRSCSRNGETKVPRTAWNGSNAQIPVIPRRAIEAWRSRSWAFWRR